MLFRIYRRYSTHGTAALPHDVSILCTPARVVNREATIILSHVPAVGGLGTRHTVQHRVVCSVNAHDRTRNRHGAARTRHSTWRRTRLPRPR